MRIQYAADLHTEFDPAFVLDNVGADILVLAGDIGPGSKGLLQVANASDATRVVFVPGNHEFYGRRMDEVVAELRLACANSAGRIHYLPDGPLVLDGLRFIGDTLWTDFELQGEPDRIRALIDAERNIRDYKVITAAGGGRLLKPTDTMAMHRDQLARMRGHLSSRFDGETVVVTHHAPSAQSINGRYSRRSIDSTYASALEGLILEFSPSLWFHGHTHKTSDYEIGSTRVLVNPRGYKSHDGLNPEFSASAIIELAPARRHSAMSR